MIRKDPDPLSGKQDYIHAMKKPFIITFILLLLGWSLPLRAEKPLVGISGIRGDSARTLNLSGVVETHLANIINSTGIFEQVNHQLLRNELTRFKCIEESCILRFARTAGLHVVIGGEIEDRGDTLLLSLRASGIGAPHFGRVLLRYRVEIPVTNLVLGAREFSYICEEHAGFFLSKMIKRFRLPLELTKKDEEPIRRDQALSGRYDLYRYIDSGISGPVQPYHRIGRIEISDNVIVSRESDLPHREGDFILISFEKTSRFLENFYRGRKKEIVLEAPSFSDTLYTVLFTVPASATMPVVAPLIGYYHYRDFTGLSLWAVNVAPYLYIEYDGLTDRPGERRDRNKNISRRDATHYYFGWYMLLFGGMSLFVDAFSHRYLSQAANYQEPQPLMGNDFTAAYLALVCGGGGHFYRGHRAWGYLYFHVDNILLYLTIRALVREERYSAETGAYERSSIDRRRAYMLLGVLGLVKICEITHAVLIGDTIRNGTRLEEELSLKPVLYLDEEENAVWGVQYSLRL